MPLAPDDRLVKSYISMGKSSNSGDFQQTIWKKNSDDLKSINAHEPSRWLVQDHHFGASRTLLASFTALWVWFCPFDHFPTNFTNKQGQICRRTTGIAKFANHIQLPAMEFCFLAQNLNVKRKVFFQPNLESKCFNHVQQKKHLYTATSSDPSLGTSKGFPWGKKC